MGNVTVEVELTFDNTASPDQIPTPDAVIETIIRAVNNSNNTLGFPIDRSSIKATGK